MNHGHWILRMNTIRPVILSFTSFHTNCKQLATLGWPIEISTFDLLLQPGVQCQKILHNNSWLKQEL